jgi:hypothetical protein
MGLLASVELTAVGGAALGQNSAEHGSGRPFSIRVRVYNYAQVSNETLTQAESEAGEIFHATGVEIE